MIYADYAAASPMTKRALDVFTETARSLYGNPSSLHQCGQDAHDAMEHARRQCADMIHAQPDEVVFTSGGTESDNFALRGMHPERIITSAVEHPAVLRTAEDLARRGVRLTVLPVDEGGVVSLCALETALRDADGKILVSVMLANNETGVIQPAREIGRLAHAYGALFHCDAVQGAGHVPVDVSEFGCDLMSVSAHKLGGPKVVGFLYVRRGVKLDPILTGGGQEHGLRSGTESVPLIAAFGAACEEASRTMDAESARLSEMRDRIEAELMKLDDVRRNGEGERLPGILNLSFGGVGGEALTLMCDLRGLAVSSGSACHAGDETPSHVLTAMNVPEKYRSSALRISLGHGTSDADAEEITRIVTESVKLLREMRS
ncbi:MAG: cysteine desulfurase [Clostridia bacterium]|nr:cysteine desulfurase [Clostridia bacterium]